MMRNTLRSPLRIAVLSLFGSFASVGLTAQLTPQDPTPIVGARNLALSPDGTRIAFAYRGDVWVAPSEGGRATPITNHIAMDDFPIWSPDGRWVAYGSTRSGNWDIYVAPVDGGNTQRLTYYSGHDIPSDWSADGRTILFRSDRDQALNGIYEIDVASGELDLVMLDPAPVGSPRYIPNSDRILFARYGFPWYRPRYQGASAAALWVFDRRTGDRRALRDNGYQHLWNRMASSGRSLVSVTVSETTPSTTKMGQTILPIVDSKERTPNLYQIELDGKASRLTDFVGGGVRFSTVASNADLIAFEYEGAFYTMTSKSKPKKISIFAGIDDKTSQTERLVLSEGVSNATLSPKGDKVAFVVRGEIWMVASTPGKGPNANDAIQLTDWAGVDNQPLWDPDNQHLFFTSDRTGSLQLYRMDTETRKVMPYTRFQNDVFSLSIVPKGQVAFWVAGDQGGLYTVPIVGGQPRRILDMPGSYFGEIDPEYSFSPDGRYVAYSQTLPNSGFYYWESTSNIFIKDLQTGVTHNVTQLSARHDSARFSPDGKYLFFVSDRQGLGIYVLPLTREEQFAQEMEYKKPEGPVTTEIDFSFISDRIRLFTSAVALGYLRFHETTGALFFVNGNYELWTVGYNGQGARKVADGLIRGGTPLEGTPQPYEIAADQSRIVYPSGGKIQVLSLKGTPPAELKFRADWVRDLRKEREAAFYQFWRTFNRAFYDPAFHGRNWTAIRDRYAPLLDSIGHPDELAIVLNMMVGELESSHSEVGGPGFGTGKSETSAHPGLTFDYTYSGLGIRVAEVPYRTPPSYPATTIRPGQYILQINGKDVRLNEALWRDVLNEQVGRELTFLVNDSPSKIGAREVKYRGLSRSEFVGIVEGNEIERRRRYVEEQSGGKLTYMYIPQMAAADFTAFNQQIWQYTQGKSGIIFDVRDNGGGNIGDRLLNILTRKQHGYYQRRNNPPINAPGQTLSMPMAVLINQGSASNGEMFPMAMKATHLATLVGMPTKGYVIWTSSLPLIDGTSARMPSVGVYRLDGSPMENNGEKPDIAVPYPPQDYLSKKDPQLDKAIEHLMKKLGN